MFHLLLELLPILPLGTISASYDQAIQPGTLKQTWIFSVNAAYNQTFNSFCFLPSQPATLLCNNEALEWARWGLREIQQNTESLSADVCISGSGNGSGGDRRMNRWPWERIGDGGGVSLLKEDSIFLSICRGKKHICCTERALFWQGKWSSWRSPTQILPWKGCQWRVFEWAQAWLNT